jgi:hypothetical protein
MGVDDGPGLGEIFINSYMQLGFRGGIRITRHLHAVAVDDDNIVRGQRVITMTGRGDGVRIFINPGTNVAPGSGHQSFFTQKFAHLNYLFADINNV